MKCAQEHSVINGAWEGKPEDRESQLGVDGDDVPNRGPSIKSETCRFEQPFCGQNDARDAQFDNDQSCLARELSPVMPKSLEPTGCTIPQCDRASQLRGMRVMCASNIVPPATAVSISAGRSPESNYEPNDKILGHRLRFPSWGLRPNRVEMSKKWLFSTAALTT